MRREPWPPARAGLALLLLGAGGLVAQDDAVAGFERAFRDGVRLGAAADPTERARGLSLLDAAADRIPELPPARRGQAAFFVAVRRAEIQLRADQPAACAAMAAAARAAARREADVYRGPYRILVLVLLWQSLPAQEFFAGLGEDEAYLLGPEADGEVAHAPSLRVPLAILRCDLLFRAGQELAALRRLQQLGAELDGVAARAESGLDAWRRVCFQRLAWHALERRDYAAAQVWLDALPAEQTRYPRALIANQRGDHATAEREGLALASADKAFWQLVGDAREQAGRYGEASAAYESALGAAADREARAAAWNGLGDARLGLRDLDGAEAAFRQALAELDTEASLQMAAEAAETWKDLGRLAEARGRADEAAAAYWRALEHVETARERSRGADPFGGAFLEPGFLAAVDGLCRVAAGRSSGPGSAAQDALVATERGRARGLLDFVVAPPQVTQLAELRRRTHALAASTSPQALRDALRGLAGARVAGTAAQPAPAARPADRGEVARVLQELHPASVLATWLGADRAYAFVADTGGTLLCDLGPRSEAVARFGAAFAALADPAAGEAEALAAAARFFLPGEVAARLRDAPAVVFVPDTALAALPLEALPLAGEPLGAQRRVERAPSLSVRSALARRPEPEGGALIVDSVRIDAADAALFGLDALAFSAREGDLVARAHPGARRLRGAAATLPGLAELLRGTAPALVHVSTHAVASPYVPTASLLLLADGPAAMPALAALPWRGTVVLSACATAGGEARGGEGVAGMLWGPFAGGARRVVASLWRVNQQATSDFMAAYHHALAEGASHAEALRRARVRLHGSPQYRHPHYWAGFALFGPDGAWTAASSGTGASLAKHAFWVWTCLGLAGVGGAAWLLARGRRRDPAGTTP
ncbi:MAG: CHAT domain-containing protein [Planctomycetes bacterium]|nr:CHAT domain-containing protein [Planctomycetota bacterium]